MKVIGVAKQTGSALVALYAAEGNVGVRQAVLDAFTAQDNCPALVQIAKTEKDPRMRRALIERLGAIACKEATDFLLGILDK